MIIPFKFLLAQGAHCPLADAPLTPSLVII